MAKLLLANKADVNAKNDRGETPLHLAAKEHRKDVAELLLAKGAEVNAKDNEGYTPFSIQSYTPLIAGGIPSNLNRKDIKKLLRQHGGHE
jgi:hypothetical protein